jgi:DNA repair exonuclease SbcCD ATPase subunit
MEKLTDDERARLERMYQTPLGRKALRIMDAQAAALDRVRAAVRVEIAPSDMTDEQALQNCQEAIRRVRMALATVVAELKAAPEHTARPDVSGVWEAMGELTSYLVDGKHMLDVDDVRRVVERALAAAPEHTGPDDPRVETFANALAAANARVAELEATNLNLVEMVQEQRHRLLEANARADAAEQAQSTAALFNQNLLRQRSELSQALHASEHWSKESAHHRDEAAALRAEVARLTEHRERLAVEAGKLRGEYSERNRREQSLRDEASSLRAEVERLKDALGKEQTARSHWADEAMHLRVARDNKHDLLSTATELLGRWCTAGAAERLKAAEATRAFLSTTAPADAAERKARETSEAALKAANARADAAELHCQTLSLAVDGWKAKCEAAERAEAQCRQNAAQDVTDSHGAVSAVRALIKERKHPRFGAGYGAIYVPELEQALVNYPCDSAESEVAAAPEHTVTHLECRLCGDPLDADHPKGPCVPCHELPEKDAAPEHTGPDDCDTRHEGFSSEAHRQAVLAVDSLRPRLAAANARVAELEANAIEASREAGLALANAYEQTEAANARIAELEDLLQRAESEVASLRAEVKTQTELRAIAQRGEDQAAEELRALRAEVERLRDSLVTTTEAAKLRKLVATASDLLADWIEQADSWEWNASPYEETQAFLQTTAPAPTEREKAERAVKE